MYPYLVVRNLFWKSQFVFDTPRGMFPKVLTKHLELYKSNIPMKGKKHSPPGILDGSLSLELESRLNFNSFKKLAGSKSVPSS